MIVPIRMFRARFQGAPAVKGVMIFGIDDRAPIPPPFDQKHARFTFKADNGALRSYLGSFLHGADERAELIEDDQGPFVGNVRSSITFRLPGGEMHTYELLREMEVTEGAEDIAVVSVSLAAIPKASPYRG
jgi:hypothetical protein